MVKLFFIIHILILSLCAGSKYIPYPSFELKMNNVQEKAFNEGFVQEHTKIQDLSPMRLDADNTVNVKETIPWKTKILSNVVAGSVWEFIPYKFEGALRFIVVMIDTTDWKIQIYEIGTDSYFYHIGTFPRTNSGNMHHYILDDGTYYFDSDKLETGYIYKLNSKEKMTAVETKKENFFTTDRGFSNVLSHDGIFSVEDEWGLTTSSEIQESSVEDEPLDLGSIDVEVSYSENENDYIEDEDPTETDISTHGLKLTNIKTKEEKILFSYTVIEDENGWYIGHKAFSKDDKNIYFDNAGGFACIWRYNFTKHSLEKVVPEHETYLLKVITYKDKDYVLYYEDLKTKGFIKIATH